MNYLWGAVNAISAPYQYYKELPPINPATLTGAIDVIVIRRSAAEGDTELACSPFHVRFGKWQVLRPAEKKVNVTVNGKPIPFNMKIGDAGEAFFVFETEGDVPDDLITSPVLQPTRPGQPEVQGEEGGRFGAKEDIEAAMHPHEEGATEPEFLDLNAPESSLHERPKPFPRVESPEAEPSLPDKSTVTPEATQPDTDNESNGDSSLLGRTTGFGKTVVHAVMEQEREKTGQLQDRADAARNVVETMTNGVSEQFKYGTHSAVPADTGDEALPKVKEEDIQTPEILNNGDVVIDMSGYHSQPSKPSQHAEHDASPRQSMTLPAPSSQPSSRASSRSRPTLAPLNIETSTPRLNVQAPSPIASPTKPSVPFPIIRAPSEPPPDSPRAVPPVLNHASTSTSTPEYSWEWGAFPQRSPYRAQFPKVPHADIAELSGESEGEGDDLFHRSKSLPPELDMETGIVSSPESLVRLPSQEEERRPHEMGKGEEELTSEGEQERAGEKPAEDAERKSWVRWWRRNSKTRTQSVDEQRRELKREGERERKVSGHGERPLLQGHVSEPAETDAFRRSQTIAVPPVSGPAPPGVPPEAVEELPAPVSSKDSHRKKFAKTLRLTSDQLKSLDLQPGANTITFSLSTTGVVACTARIFVWDSTDHIVVSDIDGTITKSDALGHVFTMIGRDWTHLGVAKLYTDICRNGYRIMYLTSRAIGQADSTRYYLQGIKQNDYQLPEGPVIMSPDRLMASLHREVIMRKPEVFKMACLRDIQRLFGPTNPNPFYAGFGNRITDALSYRSVNVPSSRIFTIDSNGEVKMELLELAGYKSPSVASYIHMTDLVDQMFPPIQHKWETEFTDNNYWKAPMPEFDLPDLTPPSPALSARSDTSNQSAFARLRNFSLRSNTSSRSHTLSPPPRGTPRGRQMSEDRDPHLRQLSSLERLSNTLSGLTLSSSTPRRSLSPQSSATYSNSEEEEEDLEGGKRRRVRKRSLESMPGSLPGSRASFSEDEEEMQFGGEGGEDGYGHEVLNEEAAEHAFDEDLFATGEMQNVPFL